MTLTLGATDSLCRAAGAIAEKYSLRGFDSIHLASFAEIVRRAGSDTQFSSFDERLNQAAVKLKRTRRPLSTLSCWARHNGWLVTGSRLKPDTTHDVVRAIRSPNNP